MLLKGKGENKLQFSKLGSRSSGRFFLAYFSSAYMVSNVNVMDRATCAGGWKNLATHQKESTYVANSTLGSTAMTPAS
jgi:hypothetical protein